MSRISASTDRVPPRRILVHRRQAQHVEVGPRRADYAALRAGCRVRAASDGRAAARCFEQPPFGFSRRQHREIERQPSGEQLVQDDAERVDVGLDAVAARRESARAPRRPASCRRNAVSVWSAARVDAHRAASRCRSRAASRVPSARDQDVRRLEVAMDDQMPVRVLHGFADVAERAQPLATERRCVPAVLGERNAFDVLHANHGVPSGSVSASYSRAIDG